MVRRSPASSKKANNNDMEKDMDLSDVSSVPDLPPPPIPVSPAVAAGIPGYKKLSSFSLDPERVVTLRACFILSNISRANLAVSRPLSRTSQKPALLLAPLQPSIADAANDSAGRVQTQQESLLLKQVLASFTQIKCETTNVTAAFPPHIPCGLSAKTTCCRWVQTGVHVLCV